MGGRAEGKTLTKPTRVRGRHLGTRLSLMPKGREEVGVSSGAPLGPEIPRVPFSLNSPKEWRLRTEDEATYLSALPARGLRPSVLDRPACLALRGCSGSVSRGARRLPRAGSAAARSPGSFACQLAGGSSSESQSGLAPPLLSLPRSP